MTTKEAFEKLLSTKGIHKKMGITAKELAGYRYDYKNQNRGLSVEKMESILKLAGWVKVPEYWRIPEEEK